MTCALIVAGGSASRFGGDIPKQYVEVCGRPLLSWTVSRFEAAKSIDQIVIVAAEEYLLYVSERVVDPFGFAKVSKIVIGGETRQESVLKGLNALPLSTSFVAIHDGARPLVSPTDIDHVVEIAKKERAAILAAASTDTIKHVADGFIIDTKDRRTLYRAQTPQVFQFDLILSAHKELAESENVNDVTDDASLIERKGFKVRIVQPTAPNLKVTEKSDLILAKALLEREAENE
jgi:2-C-methyl-D-erythritol 4-phosphate cytidylyltransferase